VTPRPNYAFLAIVSMITVAADLGTKWWAIARLSAGFDGPEAQPIEWAKRIVVVKNHLVLVFARNPGGAWGILQGESEAVRRPFFLLISVAAVVFIVSLYRKLDPRQWALKWGLPLVLGGALGNLVDRIRYAYVVDFIRIWITRTFEWPTFNVADVAIVAGVGLMAIDMFTSRKPAPPAPEAPPPAPEG
jgi:signal peptidase II